MKTSRARALIEGRWPALVVPVLALLLVLPLLRGGPSCGHDFDFHLQSWIEAADQMRHGTAFPHWAYSPAYNAGEPRFVFYPPLSWLFGAGLVLALPSAVVPAVFTWVALTLSGWGMLPLARRFTGNAGALLAASVYLANPYMLFTAFERTAYAELLAAAWMPWLLRAALADTPSPLSVAVPVALLWLTNAPAAVMGTYTLGTMVLLRLVWRCCRPRSGLRGALEQARTQFPLLRSTAGGLALGLSSVAFYLVPAAVERRFVQISMAIIPGMRVEDNFLFGHTGNGPHDGVVHTASLIALGLLALIAAGLLLARRRLPSAPSDNEPAASLIVLGGLTLLLAAMLTRSSLPLWHVLPELAFLQFPWRFASVLGCIFGAVVALAIGPRRVPGSLSLALALAIAGGAGWLAIGPFRQGCERSELPAEHLALYGSHHGVGPTDEYTPTDADNDQLRWDDPAWWLTADPNGPGPGTVPNPAATIVNYDVPPPLEQTVSGRAPRELLLNLPSPKTLVLNLRAYPAWGVTVNGAPAHWLQRDDGLVAIALPPGSDDVRVRWRTLPDVWLGDGLTVCALLLAGWRALRSRRINTQE